LIVLSAILAPVISPYDPNVASMNGNIVNRVAPIGSEGHILGTDEQGRDMLSRLFYGGRMSLLAGVFPILVALVLGSALGISAGFIGGRINMLIMRFVDMFYAFPFVLLAIAISGALGLGLNNTLIALPLVFTPPITRVAESITTQIRTMDIVESAQASGAGIFQVMRYHIVANVAGAIVIYATTLVGVQHHRGGGAELPRLGRISASCRVGNNVEHPAPVHLHRSMGPGRAGVDDFPHCAGVQSVERRPARCVGRSVVGHEQYQTRK
jgi:peptide/nickel transport system permease protein